MPRYYTTQRPPMPGCIPSGASTVKSFDTRRYVPVIDREAWGYVEYDDPLLASVIDDYELTPEPETLDNTTMKAYTLRDGGEDVALISLAEYAHRHGRDPATVRQKVNRGKLPAAQKIGRNWVIDEDAPYPDERVTSGKYIGWRKANDDRQK